MTTRTRNLTALTATLLLAVTIGLILAIAPSASADQAPEDVPQYQMSEHLRNMGEMQSRMHHDPPRGHHGSHTTGEAKEPAFRDGMHAPEGHHRSGPGPDEAEHDHMHGQMHEQMRDDCGLHEDRPRDRANQSGTMTP